MVALDVGFRRNIKIAMSRRLAPTDTMRIVQIKAIFMMAATGGTAVGAKTELRGGRLNNGRRGDQRRRDYTYIMILEIEALSLVEDADAIISRDRTTSRISIVSHKVMSGIIKQKERTIMARRCTKMVNMVMMTLHSRNRTVGHQRSNSIVPITAMTRLTKTWNMMLDIPCKTEEVRTTVERRKRQRLDPSTSSPTLSDLKISRN